MGLRGTALPFGIGAVVGGLANRASARAIARHADLLLPPSGTRPPVPACRAQT